jgi:hypothetical protein
MVDKNRLAFDYAPTRRAFDENGFLRVSGNHITKETVNPYYGREVPGWQELGLDPERVYYGYRSGDELKKAVRTFEGLPLLLGHHVESADDPQKAYRVGSSGSDAVWNSPYIDISLFVTDAEGIRAIEDGKAREISCAYLYEPDFHPGEFGGQAYDFVMRNIRGNHIALVEEGRAGADVVVADAQIKPNNRMRYIMDLFKKFRGAMDEIPAPAEEQNMAKDGDKLKAMLAALKDAGKISEEEFAALCAAAFDEEPQPVENPAKDEENDTVRDAINEAVEKIEKAKEGGEIDDEFKLKMKAAADACGLDAESPEFQKAFSEGVKYGEEKEKEEPKRLDSLHESEGMKRAMDEEEVKAAMDAAIKLAAKQAHDASVAKFRDLSAAAEACRPVLGNIDALAFDSADDIYGAALKKSGIDITKHPRAAWRSMFMVLPKGVQHDTVRVAQDASFKDYDGPFKGMNLIRKA